MWLKLYTWRWRFVNIGAFCVFIAVYSNSNVTVHVPRDGKKNPKSYDLKSANGSNGNHQASGNRWLSYLFSLSLSLSFIPSSLARERRGGSKRVSWTPSHLEFFLFTLVYSPIQVPVFFIFPSPQVPATSLEFTLETRGCHSCCNSTSQCSSNEFSTRGDRLC